MKKGRSDITLLMAVMTLFGASVCFLQWQIAARRAEHSVAHESTQFAYVSDLKIDAELQPLLYTRSIGSIVGIFKKFDADTMCSTAHAVVHDPECPLNNEERLSLLLALAVSVSYNRPLQDRIFSILADYHKRRGIEPLLLATVRGEHAAVAVDLLTWAQKKSSQLANDWVQQVFKVAIDQNDMQALEALYMRGIRLSPEQATECLMYIVHNDKDPKLVPFFVKWGKADINYVNTAGRSLVAEAVIRNNPLVAQALVAEGAIPPSRRSTRSAHPFRSRVPSLPFTA